MNDRWNSGWTSKIEFLVGDENVLQGMAGVPALPVFSDRVVFFLNELSRELRKDSQTKEWIDVLSYAFWIRSSSIEKEKENHIHYNRRIGRGISYHIAPSNVPINFAVSMTSALLAGNACIIRVSDKEFEQVTIVCQAMQRLLEEKHREMKPYLCIMRYGHDEEVTQRLSDLCDIRIIWGGNQTVAKIRRALLPPRAVELAFPDRYSLAVIHADEYLAQDCEKVARDFYTDTYYSDQNACSSPRMVIWVGEKKTQARERFWETLRRLVHQDYELHPIQAVNKLDSYCMLAATGEDGIRGFLDDNYLYRIEVGHLSEDIMEYKDAGGYFMEYMAQNLEEIVPVLGKTCQTVAVLGVDEEQIREIVNTYGVRGVDRIVPVGKTMELSFRWDGYDMIETMSRIVNGI